MIGCAAPPCSTIPPRNHGSPASRAAAMRRRVGDDRIVHQMGHRAAAVRVQPEREDAERERLEVVHEVAADDVGVADPRAQQQARRLERARAEDDVARG